MSTAKWKGAAGLARTADASSTAAVQVYPIAETIDAKGDPAVYERNTSQQPDILDIKRAGMNYSYSVDGAQMNCRDLGYLWWLALGAQAFATGTHTLSPADDSNFFNLKVDRKVNIPSNPTEEYLGCKIGSISFEQPLRDYARVSFNGLAADLGTPSAALSPTIPTAANDAPVDWSALGAGSFKIGYSGGAPVADTTIQGFKLEMTRNQAYAGFVHSATSSQPSAILEGGRRLVAEYTREFTGALATADYSAWLANTLYELDINYVVGAHSFRFQVHEAVPTGSFAQEVGTGEDAIMATMILTAKKPDGGQLATVEVVDAEGGTYT